MRKPKKKAKELTTEQIKTSIYNNLHRYIGDVSAETGLIELIEKYGERKYDEGWDTRKDYDNERAWYE